MKTLNDLFELIAQAIKENNKYNNWFINYSGHVNKLSITYFQFGWSESAIPEKLSEDLNEEGIQSAYWFIKSRLEK